LVKLRGYFLNAGSRGGCRRIRRNGFEAGLEAGDDGFVDVALALLFTGGFNVESMSF